MKKLSILFCISSLFCFSIKTCIKPTDTFIRKHLLLERSFMGATIAKTGKTEPERLIELISDTQFERTCTSSGRYASVQSFHKAILHGDPFAISAVLAYEDMRLQIEKREPISDPMDNIREAAKVSVHGVKKSIEREERETARNTRHRKIFRKP